MNQTNSETSIWRGTPSQWTNFWAFFFGILLCWLIIPLGILIYKWLQTKTTVYEVTSQRIKFESGILSKTVEEIELYRVKDTSLEQPFLLRLVGLGNILIRTMDESTPDVMLRAVPSAAALRENMRVAIEAVRERKSVRTFETL
ncbi:MAG: hypothetical protein RL341_2072 [Pseudomonadota bacterium]|jgi:uncharacterized membrane protein YdbT with pleckstrin-like domain